MAILSCEQEIHRLADKQLLTVLLMKSFIGLYTHQLKLLYVASHEAIAAAYGALSAVCDNWWQTMNGWPQSYGRHWLRHQLYYSAQC